MCGSVYGGGGEGGGKREGFRRKPCFFSGGWGRGLEKKGGGGGKGGKGGLGGKGQDICLKVYASVALSHLPILASISPLFFKIFFFLFLGNGMKMGKKG